MTEIARPLSLDEFKKSRLPLRNAHQESVASLKPLDRFALFITRKVGTIGFFLIIFFWTAFWLGWNALAPKALQFDPPMAFVLWLFISNVIQILLMPLIMVGQNIQGTHSEARAKHDLEVNIKAEREIEIVLSHLEYQNSILIEMAQNLKITSDNLASKLDKT